MVFKYVTHRSRLEKFGKMKNCSAKFTLLEDYTIELFDNCKPSIRRYYNTHTDYNTKTIILMIAKLTFRILLLLNEKNNESS